jgi:hypothetical protein
MTMVTTKDRPEDLHTTAGLDLMIDKVDVWASTLMDRPGGLAEKLEALQDAGADLQFILARRAPDKPGGGVLFVTPLQGDREIEAAAVEGFSVTRSLQSLRVEGPDCPGIVAALLRRLADDGLSLQGLSAAVIGARFVVYLGLDSAEDSRRAVKLLRTV